MDRQTAHRTIRDHRPRRLWWLVGRRRCRQGCGTSPCNALLHAIDERTRAVEAEAAQAAIARITDLMGQLREEAFDAIAVPPNAGRWWA